MEKLLHYCWHHRLFDSSDLRTTEGRRLEIVDVGLPNRHAGPDFFNARIRIDDMLWVGNVELHVRSSDWYRHGHDEDPRYDNVVLHVVSDADKPIRMREGRDLPQLQIDVPSKVRKNYDALLRRSRFPACFDLLKNYDPLKLHNWLSALQAERLEQRTEQIAQRAERFGGSWERAYFTTLARNFGFGVNGTVFEMWAASLPMLSTVAHHRDDLFQVEALFLGHAGLLAAASLPVRYREVVESDDYFLKLQGEYRYLSHKFNLQPIDGSLWRFLRLRPQNFPYIRIVQLANLYYAHRTELSSLLEAGGIEDLRKLYRCQVSDYWQTHYMFGAESSRSTKRLSNSSLDLLLINTAIPMLFACGRHYAEDDLCERALRILEQVGPENNYIVRMWRECGVKAESAADTQALVQLKTTRCDHRKCLDCRIAYEYLRQ